MLVPRCRKRYVGIYGARLGTYMTMLTDWDHSNVQWFDNYVQLWEEYGDMGPYKADELGVQLKEKLGFFYLFLTQSKVSFLNVTIVLTNTIEGC